MMYKYSIVGTKDGLIGINLETGNFIPWVYIIEKKEIRAIYANELTTLSYGIVKDIIFIHIMKVIIKNKKTPV